MSKIFVDEMQGNTGTTITVPSTQKFNRNRYRNYSMLLVIIQTVIS